MTTNISDTKSWDEFIKILEEKHGIVGPWLSTLEPVGGLFDKSENGIFLIKSNQNFAIQFLQTKHSKDIEQALEDYTGLKRSIRFSLDTTIKKKQKKYTPEEKIHLATARKMENFYHYQVPNT